MKAKDLNPFVPVVITGGPYDGHIVTVKDATPVPDGWPNQRKVLVTIPGVGAGGADLDYYILPRLLELPSAPKKPEPAPALPWSPPVPAPEPAMATADLTFIERGKLVAAEPVTDPMDPSLDEFRPDPQLVKEYVSRTVAGGLSDIEYLLHLRDQRDRNGYSPNVALVGETQSGKTMLVRVLACLAAERDGLPKPYPIFTLNGSMGITSYDLFGQTSAVIVDGHETLVWMDGLVPRAINCGGFLYLDEWNAVAPQQATALHPILDDRREFVNYQKAVPDGHNGFRPERVKANTSLWVLATINPGYKGTQTMAEASTNRFRWLSWDYDATTEEKLIPSATVRLVGEALRTARSERALTVPLGTSALQRFNHDCATFGVDNAVWVLMGMYPPVERDRVRTIIEDRGFEDLLKAEYPNPMYGEQTPPVSAQYTSNPTI
jgi:nitric oxide reductase NorQ protein